MSKERKPGWYWVIAREGDDWQPTPFNFGHWKTLYSSYDLDSDLFAIDERPITREQLDELEILRELNEVRKDLQGFDTTKPLERLWNRANELEEKLKALKK